MPPKTAAAQPELNPCPFCGSTPAFSNPIPMGALHYKIICKGCRIATGKFSSKAAAANVWNRRENKATNATEARRVLSFSELLNEGAGARDLARHCCVSGSSAERTYIFTEKKFSHFLSRLLYEQIARCAATCRDFNKGEMSFKQWIEETPQIHVI